uniref:Uncharacterized protein n=1 Tax=Iridovirus LCIVAC01 TaxID=2506607 RepID=A0A481YQE2_9VIRU|nr:MAG: hypothetical protein LCIVAC01_01970 [Iridovirus LCIVAC01]
MNNDETFNNNSSINKILLIPFLKHLTDYLENDKLEPKQVQLIGEFFMKFKCAEQVKKETNKEFSEEEIMKFFTLGYYVYQFLLDE